MSLSTDISTTKQKDSTYSFHPFQMPYAGSFFCCCCRTKQSEIRCWVESAFPTLFHCVSFFMSPFTTNYIAYEVVFFVVLWKCLFNICALHAVQNNRHLCTTIFNFDKVSSLKLERKHWYGNCVMGSVFASEAHFYDFGLPKITSTRRLYVISNQIGFV